MSAPLQPFIARLRTTMKVNTGQVQKQVVIHNFLQAHCRRDHHREWWVHQIVEEVVPVTWFGASKRMNLPLSGKSCIRYFLFPLYVNGKEYGSNTTM